MTISKDSTLAPFDVGVIGGGPAGLMAAEVIAGAGLNVTVFETSASVGRKFLLAGKGGLNLTHGEPLAQFLGRYHGGGEGAAEAIARWLANFGPQALRDWCHELGIETFVGSSGRVFPSSLKAAPLLRAWLHRLRGQGVRFAVRHRWSGWDETGAPRLMHDGQPVTLAAAPRAWVLALGGGSWPHLGSDGAWLPWLRERGVTVHDLLPSNCGFDVAVKQADGTQRAGWSDYLRAKFAGAALKNVAATVRAGSSRGMWTQRGEIMLSDTGIEGNLVYAASARLREQLIAARGGADTDTATATLWLDLLPAHAPDKVLAEVTRPRGPRSWATHLKSRLGLDGAKLALLHEILPRQAWTDEARVAAAISALPITLTRPRPLAEAISSAGGIAFDAVTEELELKALPGVFCAGEMLDWDAPTGGYLLTACLASGRFVGRAVVESCRPTVSV